MERVDNTVPQRHPVRVLSLDGGGVRGLSSIMILKHLMENINEERKLHGFHDTLEPWQVFNLIGGTSTGGIIAIMLGRLRMSLADCEQAYLDLSRKIFTPRHSTLNFRRAIDFLQANGRFDASVLESAMKTYIAKAEQPADDALLKDPTSPCKVFVVTTLEDNTGIALLRSYRNPRQPGNFYNECRIWEAARATSAATTFFDPIQIGGYNQRFIDGGVGCNNPIEEAHSEATDLWEGRETFILSIGTGSAPGGKFGGDTNALKLIVKGMKSIVTETEKTSELFFRAHAAMENKKLLFRFNVNQGLKEIGLEEWDRTAGIAAATQAYLRQHEVLQKLKSCVDQITELVRYDQNIPQAPQVRSSPPILGSPYLPTGSPPIIQTPYHPTGSSPILQTPYHPTGSPPILQTPYHPTGSLPILQTPYHPTGSLPIIQTPYHPTGSPPILHTPYEPTVIPELQSRVANWTFQQSQTQFGYGNSIPPPPPRPSSHEDLYSASSPSTPRHSQLSPGSRTTVSSSISLVPLDQTKSEEQTNFIAKFLKKVEKGDKKSTNRILAWMTNPEIRVQLDRQAFSDALLILVSQEKPYKRYSGRWFEVVEVVLECVPDIESRDSKYDYTPLMWAVWYKHNEVVDLLLRYEASLESRDSIYGRTALMWAAKQNSWEAAQLLIRHNPRGLNATDTDGNTALAIANAGKHVETANVLRMAGAELRGTVGSVVRPAELI